MNLGDDEAQHSGYEIAPSGYPIYPVDMSGFPAPRQTRHEFLSGLHEILKPRTYLEIGVEDGFGLELSSAVSIGIDPNFHITRQVRTRLQLARCTSDEFFARDDPIGFFDGLPIDLAFIDGMHLVEFAYRDFMNIERFTGPGTVVVFDDALPRSADEGARNRHTEFWAGDAYKIAGILRQHRPDLAVIAVNTDPTGVLVVIGLDAASNILAEHYESMLAECVVADPQPVPEYIRRRQRAADALEVLWWPGWPELVRVREQRAGSPASSLAYQLQAHFA